MENNLSFWNYRVLENDDEGDPLDFGTVVAGDLDLAVNEVRERLISLDCGEDRLPVRFYPLAPRVGSGVMESRPGSKPVDRKIVLK